MTMARTFFLPVLAAAALCGPIGAASAWEPEEPINIVVGFSPGGGTDIIARHIASVAQEHFPVPLVVTNKPGASGSIAAEFVMNAEPDGYTLFVAGGSESVSLGNYQDLPYDIRKDFTGIMQIARQRPFVSVRADSEWDSLEDLIEDAKANPGEYTYASSGTGSTYHSIMRVLAGLADIELKHIPYKGGAPALAALLGGHVDMTPLAPSEAQAMMDAGEIRALAVASDERGPQMPDVPTMRELGYDVYIENIKGLAGPAGIDDEVVTYLHDRFKRALDSEAFQSLADKANIEVQYRNGEDYIDAMSAMYEQIGEHVR